MSDSETKFFNTSVFARVGQLPAAIYPEFERCCDARLGYRVQCVPVASYPETVEVLIRRSWPKKHRASICEYYKGFADCRRAWAASCEREETFRRAAAASSPEKIDDARSAFASRASAVSEGRANVG